MSHASVGCRILASLNVLTLALAGCHILEHPDSAQDGRIRVDLADPDGEPSVVEFELLEVGTNDLEGIAFVDGERFELAAWTDGISGGAVVSTGAVQIMDVGMLRLPFRGWFVLETGEDMELNGCVPDAVVWPEPGQMPAGKDVQLEKAVEVLLGEVKAAVSRPQPKLRFATER